MNTSTTTTTATKQAADAPTTRSDAPPKVPFSLRVEYPDEPSNLHWMEAKNAHPVEFMEGKRKIEALDDYNKGRLGQDLSQQSGTLYAAVVIGSCMRFYQMEEGAVTLTGYGEEGEEKKTYGLLRIMKR